MPFQLPNIYPLTDIELSGMSHEEQVRVLSKAGARFIQIREKRLSAREFAAEAAAALETAQDFGTKIIINDRVDIAMLIGADGVHLGQEDLPPVAARRVLGDDAIIGFSTHTLDQVEIAMEMPIDYLAFGPIFPTSTKTVSESVVGLVDLNRVRDLVGDFPVVAIGGINAANLSSVLRAGPDSSAVIGAVFRKDKPADAAFQELVEIANGL